MFSSMSATMTSLPLGFSTTPRGFFRVVSGPPILHRGGTSPSSVMLQTPMMRGVNYYCRQI